MHDKLGMSAKRHPLITRAEDGTVSRVFCSVHPANIATFYCVACGEACCEKCFAEDGEGGACCVQCSDAAAPPGEVEGQPVTDSAAHSPARNWVAAALVGLIVLLSVYVIQHDKLNIGDARGISGDASADAEFLSAAKTFRQLMSEAANIQEPPKGL